MKTNPKLKNDVGVLEKFDQSSYDAAVGLFTLPELRSLVLWKLQLDASFYTGMDNVAPYSQVMNTSNQLKLFILSDIQWLQTTKHRLWCHFTFTHIDYLYLDFLRVVEGCRFWAKKSTKRILTVNTMDYMKGQNPI